MKKAFNKNIYLSYLFHFFCNFTICDGIWVLYLGYRGLSLAQIGIMEGIFHAASLATEIPSGALADLWGRKKILLLSRVCAFVSTLFMIFADNLWLFGIGFVFTAWSYNLLSGSEEALVYDSLLEQKAQERYYKINGRMNFLAEVSQGISVFLGGIVAERSYLACYLTALGLDVVSMLPCLFMTEPSFSGKRYDTKLSETVRSHFSKSFRLIKESREIRYILSFYSMLFAFYTSAFFYSQQFYFERGHNRIVISTLLLVIGGFSCLGAVCSEWIYKKCGEKTGFLGGIAIAAGLIGMTHESFMVSVSFFCLSSFANAMLYPLQSEELNSRIPSEQRATIISVSSMFFSVFMIVLFPMIGLAGDMAGLSEILRAVGIVLAAGLCYRIGKHVKA